ncbi:MAG: glutathione S-transferase family protein [Dongiaceae bacterium]
MPTLYNSVTSGNAYKVRLALALLGIPYKRIDLDVDSGATRTPEFLVKNPNGRVPLLELDDGTLLAESNAILVYLAEGSTLWPDGRLARARALQWMFFEQYSHEPYIAVVRHWRHLGALTPQQESELPGRIAKGYQALDVMEKHLTGRRFFVGERCTTADIALYAYTHVAPEGGFDLGRYRAIQTWLDRIAAEPGHVPIAGASEKVA